MSELLNLDTAGSLDIVFRAGHSWDFTIEPTDPDNTPELFADATVTMLVGKNGKALVSYGDGGGLQVLTSKSLRISRNAIEATLPQGKYEYEIRVDYLSGNSLPFATGNLYINPTIPIPV
jgi:hypothetical protein